MKRLLIIAAMLCGTAFADTVATLENTAGGLIVITNLPCADEKQGKIAYSTSDSASTQFGCWFTDDNFVHIRWDRSGNLRSYPYDGWKLAPKKQKGNTL